MPICLLREQAAPEQIAEMLADWGVLIKLVVDIRRGVMTGGGEMHADGQALLLENGSRPADLWGANWYPDSNEVRYEALINIRPRDGNYKMDVQNEETRQKMEAIIRRLLPGDL